MYDEDDKKNKVSKEHIAFFSRFLSMVGNLNFKNPKDLRDLLDYEKKDGFEQDMIDSYLQGRFPDACIDEIFK